MVIVLLALILFALLFPGVLRFLVLAALTLFAVLFVMEAGRVRAEARDIPQWDVDRICRQQIGSNAESLELRLNLKNCIASEQSSYEFLKNVWEVTSENIKTKCINLQNNGFPHKYGALATCISNLSYTNGDEDIPETHFRP